MATTKKKPMMLTSHTYWSLDGFQSPNTPLALNHTLQMLYSGQRVAIDNIDIPTGDILANQQYGAQNFWSTPKQLSTNITSPGLLGTCGFNCTCYGTCYPFNRDAQLGGLHDWREAPATAFASPWSGSQADVYTDQQALQMYLCNDMNGELTLYMAQHHFSCWH